MTPEQAWTRVRQIAFELEKADYGMGMPRDYQRVLELRAAARAGPQRCRRHRVGRHHIGWSGAMTYEAQNVALQNQVLSERITPSMPMQRQMKTSEQINELAAALAAGAGHDGQRRHEPDQPAF